MVTAVKTNDVIAKASAKISGNATAPTKLAIKANNPSFQSKLALKACNQRLLSKLAITAKPSTTYFGTLPELWQGIAAI